jgi:hypothetical protein
LSGEGFVEIENAQAQMCERGVIGYRESDIAWRGTMAQQLRCSGSIALEFS